jgi:hypothetical protein
MMLAKEFGWKENELAQKASDYLESVKQVMESRLFNGVGVIF